MRCLQFWHLFVGNILLRHALSRPEFLRSYFSGGSPGELFFSYRQLQNMCLVASKCEDKEINIHISYFHSQNLRPDIPRCCPSSLANVMKRCWDANPDKRPEMDEVVSLLEAINTSKGGGMIPGDQPQGCLCFRKYRGP